MVEEITVECTAKISNILGEEDDHSQGLSSIVRYRGNTHKSLSETLYNDHYDI